MSDKYLSTYYMLGYDVAIVVSKTNITRLTEIYSLAE